MISFPDAAAWDDALEAVNFLATTAGGALVCSITSEALRHYYGEDSSASPLDEFAAHRTDIEAQAARMIDRGLMEPDGSLVICTVDLQESCSRTEPRTVTARHGQLNCSRASALSMARS